ncbi:hypothetical protein NPS33_19010 [Pseudomonas putida]|uniref:hypothetical protein n=1 Tax=Pseudomonas putida TaxID=303 RepID=UPI0023637375|nr:hypothetical protein [Pseudomonas putida]MDD2016985.1 hypothetical protein [Pseudomonas putida]HDS1772853.1 hypothetical protein [Pseudomonas putida]
MIQGKKLFDPKLTLSQNVRNTGARWNPLRRIDTLGQFDFPTAVVMLDSLETHHVKGVSLADLESKEKFDLATYTRLAKCLPLAVHEYTHFVDCTSTVWGLRHLSMLHRAYTCETTDEFKFHVMRTCYNHLKRIKLPEYYTVVSGQSDTSFPWNWRATSGREFRYDGKPGERPIFFIRFFNEAWEPIVRSPISAISLLETCAMAAELDAHASLLKRIEDDNERLIQTRIFEKESFASIYNPELNEYSVCVHLVANCFDAKEAMQAFWGSAIIARTVLNSSKDVYRLVLKNIKVLFDGVGLRHAQPEAKAIRRGLENYDPGVLFYVFCVSMGRGSLDSIENFIISLSATMRKYGVAYVRDYEKTMLQEAGNILAEVSESSVGTLAILAEAGYENLNSMVGKCGMINLHKMNLPPVLLGDNSEYKFHSVDWNKLKDLDVESSFLEMLDGQSKMQTFGDACI